MARQIPILEKTLELGGICTRNGKYVSFRDCDSLGGFCEKPARNLNPLAERALFCVFMKRETIGLYSEPLQPNGENFEVPLEFKRHLPLEKSIGG